MPYSVFYEPGVCALLCGMTESQRELNKKRTPRRKEELKCTEHRIPSICRVVLIFLAKRKHMELYRSDAENELQKTEYRVDDDWQSKSNSSIMCRIIIVSIFLWKKTLCEGTRCSIQVVILLGKRIRSDGFSHMFHGFFQFACHFWLF